MSSSRPSSPPPVPSKRGRKRNDNLPPNRARDVQRAFRARRAAHLQALEARVQELEDENACLRQALNLPPANRPPLGKGPTGKDKPKTNDHQPSQASPTGYNPIFTQSRASSVDSPGSTRTSSMSPNMLPSSSRAMQVVDSGPWDQAILMNEQQSEVPPSATSSSFSLPPLPSSPMPTKTLPQSSYPPYQSGLPPPPPPPRGSISSMQSSTNVYASPQPYAQSVNERPPLSSYASSSYNVRGDRRSVTDPQGYGQPLSQAQAHHHQQQQQQQAYMSQAAHGIRLPSPPRLPDGHLPSLRSAYGPDGTINSLA
uniref:BZIP domain-containing protein n=1 Tax=Schizophyllum commune (strain H4-8 / FGSC 9210) TaxID=578458 RepID=D8Q5I4_SCHCM